ncbi:MAG TPA: methyltransferase domain-containing protein [Chloroflexota bacterium]|nr:methyltransferase domain-containing protein [Chloroflexota bacterium]
MASAADRWRQALAEWAIPPAILAAAPESPWSFPTEVFARRADAAVGHRTPSTEQALAVLPAGGSVLDVGCGAGAAALPLARVAGHLIGVDPSASMLRAFRERGETRGKIVTTIEGAWPAVADQTPVADLVVCHNVAYNVPDLAPFVLALTSHARRRVVLELTAEHPMSVLNDLWMRFHGLARPTAPTASDAAAVLVEVGLAPERADWPAPAISWSGPNARAELVAWVRRRLCLPAARDPEIEEALGARIIGADGAVSLPLRPVVTLWWEVSRA